MEMNKGGYWTGGKLWKLDRKMADRKIGKGEFS
jgi:hypothetical protein